MKKEGAVFHADRTGLAKLLGSLEAELMEVVWSTAPPVTARDVHERATAEVKYVTVVTVLNNLWRKGLLSRERDGRAFQYRATSTREEFVRAASEGVFRGLLDLSPRIAVNSFVGVLDALSLDQIEELRAEVARHLKAREDDPDATE